MTLLLWTLSIDLAWTSALLNFPIKKIQWHKCPAGLGFPPNFECSKFEVPLDWNHPDGDKITLLINKAPAKRPDQRIGSLIINPGGPGGSASQMVAELSQGGDHGFSKELLERFDILGPDPRGIAPSTPIRCTPDLWNKRVSRIPKTEKEFNEMMNLFKEIGEDCERQTGPLINHVDTISVSHDIEAIRIALGEGPINYLGFSYGTQLGSQYAELYPHNIRAMVLDANCDHAITETAYAEDELRDFEMVVDRFFDWAKKNETSVFHGQDIGPRFDELIDRANKEPILAPGCSQDPSHPKPCRPDVSGEEILFRLQYVLLDDYNYPQATEWVSELFNGNATNFSKVWYTGRTHSDYSEKGNACQDWLHNSTWSQWKDRYNRLVSITPHLKGISWTTNVLASCQGWPSSIVNPPKPINITSASTSILLVNALYDLQTPYRWALSLQKSIKGSVLLTRDGDGHTSYTQRGDTQRAMDDYLINVNVPKPGTILRT